MYPPFDIYYTYKKWQNNDNGLLNEINVKNYIIIFKNCMNKDISCVFRKLYYIYYGLNSFKYIICVKLRKY